jgi:hypothetical protein
MHQKGVVCNTILKGDSIHGIEETLAEAKVEEEDEQLHVITVINLDTYPMTILICLQCAHTAGHWIIRYNIFPN